jgi:hypothetical protein
MAQVRDENDRADLAASRRKVNLAIWDALLDSGGGPIAIGQFLCECGWPDCHDKVAIPLGEFDPSSSAGAVSAHG